jgi:Peptidase family M28
VTKAAMAQEHGASGIILFNEGQPGRTAVPNNLPLGAEASTSPEWAPRSTSASSSPLRPGAVAHVKTVINETLGSSVNVIAETPGGDPHRTVVIGAHLDSVPAGRGINDNGSGSGGILEIAETYAQQGREPRNKLRFMWYGAEEIGLVGSTKYVEDLSQGEKDDILAMLNFDMIGSPNFARMVYDGDGTVGPEGPTGSGLIEDVFLDYFASQGLFNEPTAFDGRSDYGPFIAEGIPTGGLFTGAEVPKTAAQVASTAASSTLSWTRATTRPATPSPAPATARGRRPPDSAWSPSTRCPTPPPTPSCSSRRPSSTCATRPTSHTDHPGGAGPAGHTRVGVAASATMPCAPWACATWWASASWRRARSGSRPRRERPHSKRERAVQIGASIRSWASVARAKASSASLGRPSPAASIPR